MAKTTKSRYAILGMLALAPNSSGYDIKKLMEGSTQYFWKETFSSIYPVLQELVNDGLAMQHETQVKSGRQRNVYELTAEGKRVLVDWMNKPVEDEQFRNELLLKLFFGETVDPAITRGHVEEVQKMLQQKSKTYREIKDELEREHKNDPGLPYWLMTLDFGMSQTKAALEWSERTLKQFKILEKGK